MTSGIYQLMFSDGSCYIGKSNDIPRRLGEHRKKFSSGTAASKLQVCFNHCGYPYEGVLIECHPDHIDLMETIFINTHKPKLNTAPTSFITFEDLETLSNCDFSLLAQSTGEHINTIHEYATALVELNSRLVVAEKIRTEAELDRDLGLELERTKRTLEYKNSIITDLTRDFAKLHKRNLWQRIFNS